MKKTMSKKTPNPNTSEKSLPKNSTWHDYMSDESFRFFPGRDEWMERLIHTMYEWADQKNSISVIDFCREYKVPPTTLDGWVAKYPKMKKAYKEILLILGSNRYNGVAFKDGALDKSVIFKDQHRYDPEWDGINKYHALLSKIGDAQAPTRIEVVMRAPRLSEEVSLPKGEEDAE